MKLTREDYFRIGFAFGIVIVLAIAFLIGFAIGRLTA